MSPAVHLDTLVPERSTTAETKRLAPEMRVEGAASMDTSAL